MKPGRDQWLRCELDNFEIEWCQSSPALYKVCSECHWWIGHASGIEYYSHIFETIHGNDIFTCVWFILAHLPFQVSLELEPAHHTTLEGWQIYSMLNTYQWWWNMQEQLAAGAKVVPVVCASDKTHVINFFGHSASLDAEFRFWNHLNRYLPDTWAAPHNSHWADPLHSRRCQNYWRGLALQGYNCAVPSLWSWHTWSQLQMKLCWCIPETMEFTFRCLGQGLSRASDCCSSLIWHIPDER